MPPGELAHAGKGDYRVFSPYWLLWRERPLPAGDDVRTGLSDVASFPARVHHPATAERRALRYPDCIRSTECFA